MNSVRFIFTIIADILFLNYFMFKIKLKKDEVIIVLPDDDMEWNRYALAHLEEFLDKGYLKSVVLVSNINDNIILPERIRKNINLTYKLKKQLLASRYLSGKIIFISLNDYQFNMNKNIIGISNITKEDIICYCCYGLFDYKHIEVDE